MNECRVARPRSDYLSLFTAVVRRIGQTRKRFYGISEVRTAAKQRRPVVAARANPLFPFPRAEGDGRGRGETPGNASCREAATA